METCLQPREVVLDFGLLPLQVLCPQLETVAGVQVAHRSLAALATRGEDGNSKSLSADLWSEHVQQPLKPCCTVRSSAGALQGRACCIHSRVVRSGWLSFCRCAVLMACMCCVLLHCCRVRHMLVSGDRAGPQ